MHGTVSNRHITMLHIALGLAVALAGCAGNDTVDAGRGRDGGPGLDSGNGRDAGTADAGTADAGAEDAGVEDAGADLDAAVSDAGTSDAGMRDAGAGDAGPGDAGAGDAGPGDAGTGDAGPGDAGSSDAGMSASDSCVDAINLDLVAGHMIHGSTCGAADDVSVSCNGTGVLDRVYRVNGVASGWYSFSITPGFTMFFMRETGGTCGSTYYTPGCGSTGASFNVPTPTFIGIERTGGGCGDFDFTATPP